MAKVLNEIERENRREDIFQKIDYEVDSILRLLQDRYGIHNGECPPELAHALNVAMESVVKVMEKILDLQTEIDNRERFYNICLKLRVKATNVEEAFKRLNDKIDKSLVVSESLQVDEVNVDEMEVEE